MEIPITISVQVNTREFAENLFGLGKKITDPEIVRMLGEDVWEVNKSTTISEGITIGQPSRSQTKKAMESVQPDQWFDWNLALFITERALNFGLHGYAITEWSWNHIKAKSFKIKLDGKEISTKDQLQKTLDEYIKSHSTKEK